MAHVGFHDGQRLAYFLISFGDPIEVGLSSFFVNAGLFSDGCMVDAFIAKCLTAQKRFWKV